MGLIAPVEHGESLFWVSQCVYIFFCLSVPLLVSVLHPRFAHKLSFWSMTFYTYARADVSGAFLLAV